MNKDPPVHQPSQPLRPNLHDLLYHSPPVKSWHALLHHQLMSPQSESWQLHLRRNETHLIVTTPSQTAQPSLQIRTSSQRLKTWCSKSFRNCKQSTMAHAKQEHRASSDRVTYIWFKAEVWQNYPSIIQVQLIFTYHTVTPLANLNDFILEQKRFMLDLNELAWCASTVLLRKCNNVQILTTGGFYNVFVLSISVDNTYTNLSSAKHMRTRNGVSSPEFLRNIKRLRS